MGLSHRHRSQLRYQKHKRRDDTKRIRKRNRWENSKPLMIKQTLSTWEPINPSYSSEDVGMWNFNSFLAYFIWTGNKYDICSVRIVGWAEILDLSMDWAINEAIMLWNCMHCTLEVSQRAKRTPPLEMSTSIEPASSAETEEVTWVSGRTVFSGRNISSDEQNLNMHQDSQLG